MKQGIRGACSAPAERQANALAWPKFALAIQLPNLGPRLRGERTNWGVVSQYLMAGSRKVPERRTHSTGAALAAFLLWNARRMAFRDSLLPYFTLFWHVCRPARNAVAQRRVKRGIRDARHRARWTGRPWRAFRGSGPNYFL